MSGWRIALCLGAIAAGVGCQQGDASVAVEGASVDVAGKVAAVEGTNSVTNVVMNAESEKRVVKSEEEWRRSLTPEQYRVLREAGTERAFGAAYEEFKKQGGGTYVCAGCGAELFSSKEKFDSKCGWPSFYDPSNAQNVKVRVDRAFGMERVEVLCAVCDGHLGHVFKGEGFKTPTDKRYCINAVSLKFVPAAVAEGEKK